MGDKLSLKQVMQMAGLTAYKIHQARENGQIEGKKIMYGKNEGWEFDSDQIQQWLHIEGDKKSKKTGLSNAFKNSAKGVQFFAVGESDQAQNIEAEKLKVKVEEQEKMIKKLESDLEYSRAQYSQVVALLPKVAETSTPKPKRKKFLGVF